MSGELVGLASQLPDSRGCFFLFIFFVPSIAVYFRSRKGVGGERERGELASALSPAAADAADFMQTRISCFFLKSRRADQQ